jgi:glycosyltransferase involved in cell wall biosynthesis
MDVSIVIRTKNEAAFIEETLKRVGEQEFSGKCEIIVVDSGSTDSTLDIIKRHGVRLLQIPEKEFSYGRSLNVGASHARGEFVVNLSAHAWPLNSNWLTNLMSGFQGHHVAAIYGRQISSGHRNPFEAFLNERLFGHSRLTFSRNSNKVLRKMHFTNSNGAIRKYVWQAFKFNERVPYGEDILWQSEVIKAGFSISYAPNAAVYHCHRVSISAVYRNSMNCAYNASLVQEKTRWIPFALLDIASFFILMPVLLLQNVAYIWRNRYYRHLRIAPFWVMSGLLGSTVGKVKYRAKRLTA